ncbi:unnamed protein product [Pedinophyceae sp. YPF-701]|nr:unnamed protein product [Pedinophyceae sp. YPF-701]
MMVATSGGAWRWLLAAGAALVLLSATTADAASTVRRGRAPLAAGTSALSAARSLRASQPDFSYYMNTEAVWSEVSQLVSENRDWMQLDVVKKTAEPPGADACQVQYREACKDEYSIEAKIVTVEADFPSSGPPRARTGADDDPLHMYFIYGEHARELVTVELGVAVLRSLPDLPAPLTRLGFTAEESATILAVMSRATLKIAPMENTVGRARLEGPTKALCERKNGRGVDINRNFEVDWNVREIDYDRNEEFGGFAKLSEPEAQVDVEVVRAFRPHVVLNVHSGMEAMFTPWDHQGGAPDDPAVAVQKGILDEINARTCDGRCVVSPGGLGVGYLAHGTLTDHMYKVEKVPLVSTWEIYGDWDVPVDDCFGMFNPITRDGLKAVIDQWLRATFLLMLRLPTHPGMPASIRALVDGPGDSGEPETGDTVYKHLRGGATLTPLRDDPEGPYGTAPATQPPAPTAAPADAHGSEPDSGNDGPTQGPQPGGDSWDDRASAGGGPRHSWPAIMAVVLVVAVAGMVLIRMRRRRRGGPYLPVNSLELPTMRRAGS